MYITYMYVYYIYIYICIYLKPRKIHKSAHTTLTQNTLKHTGTDPKTHFLFHTHTSTCSSEAIRKSANTVTKLDALSHYRVATISRLLKIIGLFCRISSLL